MLKMLCSYVSALLLLDQSPDLVCELDGSPLSVVRFLVRGLHGFLNALAYPPASSGIFLAPNNLSTVTALPGTSCKPKLKSATNA